MNEKHDLFFENAKLLNELNIVPLMYGSLGLEYVVQEDLNSDDIDILIPEIYINEKWNEFKNYLEDNGYELADEHEHTFIKENVQYSYAKLEELEVFAGVQISDINTMCLKNIKFLLLSLEQYLKVYNASYKDGYRIQVRKKKDLDKILLINEKLKIYKS